MLLGFGARDPTEDVSWWAVTIHGKLVDTQISSMRHYLPIIEVDLVSYHNTSTERTLYILSGDFMTLWEQYFSMIHYETASCARSPEKERSVHARKSRLIWGPFNRSRTNAAPVF